MAIVIDASVALAWIISTQRTPLTEAVLDVVSADAGLVPSYFGIEVARVLRSRERRKLLTPEEVDVGISDLRQLTLRQDNSDTLAAAQRATTLARQYGLRIADAAYLELALRTGLPLATRDSALARAAEAAGVALFKS